MAGADKVAKAAAAQTVTADQAAAGGETVVADQAVAADQAAVNEPADD